MSDEHSSEKLHTASKAVSKLNCTLRQRRICIGAPFLKGLARFGFRGQYCADRIGDSNTLHSRSRLALGVRAKRSQARSERRHSDRSAIEAMFFAS
jgi:hypothetical protein